MNAAVCCVLWAACCWTVAVRAAGRRAVAVERRDAILATAVAVSGAALKMFAAAPSHSVLGLETVAIAAIVDARCGYIFDPVVVSGLLVVLAAAAVDGAIGSAVAGAAASAGALLAIWAATFGRGLGLGDVKLGAVIGAAFGVVAGIVTLGLSFTIGALAATGLLVRGKAQLGSAIPFGPYLLAGSLCLLAYHRLSNGVIR